MFKNLVHQKNKAVIISREKISNNLLKVDFETNHIEYTPGEYITLFIANIVPRNYSIFSVSQDKKIFSIIVNINGDGIGRRSIRQFVTYEKVSYIGPLGDFKFNKNDNSTNIWFIATGSGISPLYQMILDNKNKYNISLFFSANKKEEFPNLKFEGIKTYFSITKEDKDWEGDRGRVTHTVRNMLLSYPNKDNISFYICGNPNMVKDTNMMLLNEGIARDKIYFEKFGF